MKSVKQVLKEPKKKEPKKEKKVVADLDDGLKQVFQTKDKKWMSIKDALTPKDTWQTSGRVKRTIISHEGVKKLADLAGVSKEVKYDIFTQPDAYNNYQYTIQATVTSSIHGAANELGEANRSNLGGKGRGNPANMAQKRAYDRAVFRLLGITGLLSEEELADDEQEDTMEGLTHEDKKKIAQAANQLMLAKDQKDLIVFGKAMAEGASQYSPEQLDYLRKLYKKKVGELSTTKF